MKIIFRFQVRYIQYIHIFYTLLKMAIEHDVEPSTVDEFTQEETDTGFTYTLDMFKESQEVLQMIKNIPIICKELVSSEKGFETLKTILDQYQEQPHLLDPHLPSLLNECLCIITDEKQSQKAISQAFQYLWLVVKVRGHKIVSKKMPHEVKDLLPVLNFLEKDEFEDDFYGSYILLMWLSIIVYMPFNMMAFDATVQKTSSTKATVVERILAVTKKHLKCAQSSREMAAHLASRFVTRPDLQEYLPQFIDYCFEAYKLITLKTLRIYFTRWEP
ncbi:Tubulin-specific chaperone D [Armadillidium vulgare]|nr:Tubulin-specific chaperone D [Armadillidium vulgare]